MRIVLADDSKEVRSALRLLLQESGERGESSPGLFQSTIVEAANAAALIRHVEEGSFDIVLLDWELPGLPSGELVAEIRRLSPGCRVVAMSGQPEARKRSLALGVDGFVSKNEPPDELLKLLHLAKTATNERVDSRDAFRL